MLSVVKIKMVTSLNVMRLILLFLKMLTWCYHMYNIFAHKECQRKINKYMCYGLLRSSIKQHHYNVWKGDRQKR